jgi:transposase
LRNKKPPDKIVSPQKTLSGGVKHMNNVQAEKLDFVKGKVLIVGVDVAKKINYARFIDPQGYELCKHYRFQNDLDGIKSFISKIKFLERQHGLERTVIGMEPSGHYWEPLAYQLKEYQLGQVFVNPYHVKCSKEMADNSPSKSDQKDALLIAKLVIDGNYFKMYLPEGVYRDLRNLTRERYQLRKKLNNSKNRLIAQLDSYFPELFKVFKDPLGKTAVYILEHHPFPQDIIALALEELVTAIKGASNSRLGLQKTLELKKAANESVGINEGLASARYRIKSCLTEIAFYKAQLSSLEEQMLHYLNQTGFSRNLLSIPGVGVVTAARFLGEVGDISRFDSPDQIIKLAGLNLKTNSSGQKKGKTTITKRGRSELRSLLYQSALVMVCRNEQMINSYQYYRTRSTNPLKSKQALVIIMKKLVRIIYALMTKDELYDLAVALREDFVTPAA